MLFLLSGTSYALNIDISNTPMVKATWMDNRKPNSPEITGPSSGKTNTVYSYNFFVTDPDGDYLKAIQIEWGGLGSDNTTYICWVCEGGPLPNGTIFQYGHYWVNTGNYTIRAKVWDMQDNESDWGTFSVTMPYSYTIPYPSFWERLLERFPHAFPFFQYLLRK